MSLQALIFDVDGTLAETEETPGVERLIREAHGDGLQLAIEDTRNGVLAASAAGIPALVTQSYYSEGEDFSGALAVLSDLGEPDYPYGVLAGINGVPGLVDTRGLRSWLAAAR